MTDVTSTQESAGLSAADEQLLRELTERARAGGLTLTGEGDLSGKLVSGGVLRADEPIPGASVEMAGRIAPGRQSGLGVNAGAGFGVPHARLGGRGVIADAGGMDAG